MGENVGERNGWRVESKRCEFSGLVETVILRNLFLDSISNSAVLRSSCTSD